MNTQELHTAWQFRKTFRKISIKQRFYYLFVNNIEENDADLMYNISDINHTAPHFDLRGRKDHK